MNRRSTTVLCTALVLSTLSLFSQPLVAETSVVEAHACKFNAGKSMADLEAAAEYYKTQRSKISSPALQSMVSRVWTPVLGSMDYDFVWFNSNLNYSGWGEMRNAWDTSPVAADIDARFDAATTCARSGLYAQDYLVNNLEQKPFSDGTVTVESFLCNLHEGRSIADSDKAIAAWKPVFEKAIASTGASSVVIRRTPIISGSGFDLSYMAVWDDAAIYANSNEAFRSDTNSAKSDALFAAAHRCSSTLFTSRTLVPAPS